MGWGTVLGTPLSGLPVRNAWPGPVEPMYSLHTRLLASSLRILTSSEMDVILGFWERRVSLTESPALPGTCCYPLPLGAGAGLPLLRAHLFFPAGTDAPGPGPGNRNTAASRRGPAQERGDRGVPGPGPPVGVGPGAPAFRPRPAVAR